MRSLDNYWRRSVHSKWISALAAAAVLAVTHVAPATSLASMLGDFDARNGSVQPTSQQLGMVSAMGANASWNNLGTPSSLIKYGDYLATDLQGPDAATVARNWIDANKALFRLSSVDGLTVLSDESLPHSNVYVVSFRQEIAGLRMAEDGLLNVGIVGDAANGWKIGYAAATTTGDAGLSGYITMFPADAYVRAAQDVGANVQLSDIVTTKADGEWTTFTIDGFADLQRARMRALATPHNGVRPVYETVYIKNANTAPQAYVHYIDAEDGTVWMRKDIVEQAAPSEPQVINGNMPPQDGACVTHPETPWTVDADEEIGTIAGVVNATVTANDSLIHILYDDKDPLNGTGYAIVASQDTGTSPEAVAYSPPSGTVPPGDYKVQVCDYVDGAGWLQPDPANSYQVVVSFTGPGVNDAPGTGYPPKWTVFPANPYYDDFDATPATDPSADIRDLWCWESYGGAGCDLEVTNTASRSPWDYNVKTNAPNFTTRGNNAVTAEAWGSPLTPGGLAQQPFAADRDYTQEWTNAWNESKCVFNPAPGGNDILPAVTNLFAMHNRMHDWSYELGFTEGHWNAQDSNFGNNGPSTVSGQPVLDGDPVIGNAQAGALSGGPSGTYLGRDNANMITLQDGIPPITNMYLWQPIAGAFYAPCADGDYDMAIIGHEYGHMIENRMIGKGDGRSAHHAGAMGESFGDLAGMEILNEYGFVPMDGENQYSLGGFATGSKERGIRNYNMSYPRVGGFPLAGSSTTGSGLVTNTKVNPLNFSNMGYDFTGPQVHADGEIWSATNFTIRTYLAVKYETTHSISDADLQKACADGEFNPANCPGNRRWIQIVFDAMLLMPTAPSMLEARDAYLAADMMRFDGANQKEIWLGFAHRGFGMNASSDNTIADVVPDFASPEESNAVISFDVVAFDEMEVPVAAEIYVGHYEARVSPIADTNGMTSGAENLDNIASFAPGDYEFVVRADGYGHFRFAETFSAGDVRTVTIKMPTNYASSSKGATASGMGTELGGLIDETEATNWDWDGNGVAVDNAALGQPHVTVDLGGARDISRVQVSAMLSGQNRFTALREFKVQTSTDGLTFSDWIASGADAFPGHAPRPVAPEVILRDFSGTPTTASHVRIVALNNQCTGNAHFQRADLDDDPLNVTDCRDTTISSNLSVSLPGDPDQILAPRHDEVHIAELQVFGSDGAVDGGGCEPNCGGNRAPVADDDAASTPINTPVTIDVLDGDADPDGDMLTVTSVDSPTANGGFVSNNMDGTVTYTPASNFEGTDTFSYEVSDGSLTDTGMVTVTVFNDTVENRAPVASDDTATTSQDTAVIINVLKGDTDPDGDTLSVTGATDPANGMTEVNQDNTVTYTPDPGFFGTDTFDYTIDDSNGGTDTGTVTVTVSEDPAPVNECADDTDSDSHDCKVKGSGKIADGDDDDDDSDSDKFTVYTKQKGENSDGSPEVDGKLYVDTDNPQRKVRGTPNAQSIYGNQATVTGTCEYELENYGKVPCEFEVTVTEPDQFGVTIYNMSGGVLYSFDEQTILDGDVEVRSDEEYE